MKYCNTCKTNKELIEFYINKTHPGGYSSQCRKCILARRKIYHSKNKEHISKLRKKNYIYNDPKKKDKTYKKTYGLSLYLYDWIKDSNGGKCWICNTKELGQKGLVVDHDHTINKVRGFLCNQCNLGLGSFRDNEQVLINAAKYLNRFRNLPHIKKEIEENKKV